MNIGSKVALRDFPNETGVVKAIDHEQGTADVQEDATGIRRAIEVEELIEVSDHELPDKAWPPAGMETKDT